MYKNQNTQISQPQHISKVLEQLISELTTQNTLIAILGSNDNQVVYTAPEMSKIKDTAKRSVLSRYDDFYYSPVSFNV